MEKVLNDQIVKQIQEAFAEVQEPVLALEPQDARHQAGARSLDAVQESAARHPAIAPEDGQDAGTKVEIF